MILALSFIIGLAMAGTSTTIYAILADMSDVDELITSISRPGICSGMATFARKISAGISSALIGVLLAMAGYNETLAMQGLRQTAATQKGIAYIYVFSQIVLLAITLVFTIRFPVTKKEFDTIRREVDRRKGLDDSVTTEEEKTICENVTGFSYDRLWNEDNALKF